jgi:GxxExxY protein
MITQKYISEISYQIVGSAIEVHKVLGPGLLESIYQRCLVAELVENGLKVATEVQLPVLYKGMTLGSALKIDLLVNDLIVVELKAVEEMIPLFSAQLLSYLKLAQKPKGLLINFHCDNIVRHMIPLVTEEFAKLPVNEFEYKKSLT